MNHDQVRSIAIVLCMIEWTSCRCLAALESNLRGRLRVATRGRTDGERLAAPCLPNHHSSCTPGR